MELENISSFIQASVIARRQHQAGNFDAAVQTWNMARHCYTEDDFQHAEALRGEASSMFRRGREGDTAKAEMLALGALTVHERLYREYPGSYEAVRQIPESVHLVARIRLLPLLVRERHEGNVNAGALNHVRNFFAGRGDPAIARLQALRQDAEFLPDQHEINYWPLRAIAETLAPSGSRTLAREQARTAGRLALMSESPALPTAANISPNYARTANKVARGRASAARVIARLATPQPSLRRKGALWIATRRGIV
jgi:hypothetical protein